MRWNPLPTTRTSSRPHPQHGAGRRRGGADSSERPRLTPRLHSPAPSRLRPARVPDPLRPLSAELGYHWKREVRRHAQARARVPAHIRQPGTKNPRLSANSLHRPARRLRTLRIPRAGTKLPRPRRWSGARRRQNPTQSPRTRGPVRGTEGAPGPSVHSPGPRASPGAAAHLFSTLRILWRTPAREDADRLPPPPLPSAGRFSMVVTTWFGGAGGGGCSCCGGGSGGIIAAEAAAARWQSERSRAHRAPALGPGTRRGPGRKVPAQEAVLPLRSGEAGRHPQLRLPPPSPPLTLQSQCAQLSLRCCRRLPARAQPEPRPQVLARPAKCLCGCRAGARNCRSASRGPCGERGWS